MAFVEGTLDFAGFASAKMRLATAARGTPQLTGNKYMPTLPPGTYKVNVQIRFLDKTSSSASAAPFWNGDVIATGPGGDRDSMKLPCVGERDLQRSHLYG